MRPQDNKLCLSLDEAAKLLGVSPRFLWGLTKKNQVPHARLGEGKRKRLIFLREVLLQWLAEQSRPNMQSVPKVQSEK